ncbi:hypothetical protein MKX70_08665 [Paenibacillus sp. FSL R7-0312]|uniref:hypothetical protein n=1 Tax=Paenibacillus sp. FSL R7-0312 TaxID=2921682 RepID=UPI0030FB6457
MNILYTRYSKDRHPHFQMKTVIYEQGGLKKVKKQAVTPAGSGHIRNIFENYGKLSAHYKANVLLQPEFENDSLVFEYITARSLDELILESALNKKKKDFFYFLDQYKQIVNDVAGHNYIPFSNTEQFVHFFNKKYPLEGLNSFVTSNVDLNFDNIFFLGNKVFKILDYEWVLEFPIPVEFVAFRAINTFYYAHYTTLVNFVDIRTLFDFFGISNDRIEHYTNMSITFADYVGTNQATARLRGYLKRNVPFEFREPEIYTSQLFYKKSDEDLFSEECSVKISITSQTAILHFPVEPNMNYFRFDPADKKSIIRIEKAIAFDSAGKALELSQTHANASYITDSTYFFATDDPQVYFFIESDFNVSRIVVTLKYIQFLEDGFFLEFGKTHEDLLKYKGTLESNIEKERELFYKEKELFDKENEKLNNTIINYQSQIDEKQNQLRVFQDVTNELKVEIKKLENELIDGKKLNNDLNSEKSQLIDEIDILQNDLRVSKQYINQIESTFWWRTVQKISSFGRKISGQTKGKN